MRAVIFASVLALITVTGTGCATSQKVTLGQHAGLAQIKTAALVPEDGNSADMDSNVQQALVAHGIAVKAPLPAGTRQSKDVDVIVAYEDVWRWDLKMYLQSLTINLFDGRTGNLLATGRWDNSAFHGFQDAGGVVKELFNDMYAKVLARNPAPVSISKNGS